MASIENRIVQMQFDNTSFERRLSTTLQSLDKLNQTLANAGSRNGLTNLSESVRGFNLGPLTSSIEGVSSKFLAMATIAITALSNIVNRAVDAGIRIAKSLSLDPVTSGFQEYQTQIGAIQTILSNTSSKGTNLEQVNAALDQLNEYSDKTIYNFTEMARNIGTFTAAGVDLDTSVQSIKGIANLAAISGSSSQQAATGMYQLSQAIATGSVKLIDWNSVVNAGMGGEVFQKALFDTGVAMQTIADVPMGTSFDEWKASGNTFRASLESGWLSAEVLTATLSQFTGELNKEQIMAQGFTEAQADEIMRLGQIGVEAATKVRTLKGLIDTTKEALGSGWARSFRAIFGDFEEATELFTGFSDALGGIIQRSADARNALLEGWKELGGRQELFAGLYTAFAALSEIMAPIKEAFKEIFPPLTAQRLFDITKAFHDFAEAMRPSEKTVDSLKRIFTGFFGALEIGWTIIKETARFIGELFGSLTGAGSGEFLEFAAKIGDFFTGLNDKLVEGGGIKDFFVDLGIQARKVVARLKELAEPVEEFLSQFDINLDDIVSFFTDLRDGAKEFFDGFREGADLVAGGAINRLKNRFGGLGDRFKDLWEPLSKAFSKISEVLDGVWDIIRDWFSNLGDKMAEIFGPGEFDAVLDAVNVGLIGGIALAIKKFMSGDGFDFGGGLISNISSAFGELTDVLSAMETSIKADALLKIAAAIGIIVAALLVLSLMDSDALTKALTAMAIGFGQLLGSFALLNAMGLGPSSALKLAIMSGAMVLLAAAMLILAAAVKVLSTMEWDELLKGLVGIAGILVVIAGAAFIFSSASGPLLRGSLAMIAMGIALNILALAVKQFADMSWGEMAKGLVGVAGGLLIMATALSLMPATSILSGGGLLLTAAALIILAQAVKSFADMSWGDMGKGLAGVGGGLLLIATAVSFMPPTLPLIGLGLLLVAASLNKIFEAVESFAGMSWSEIARGMVGLGGALLILALGLAGMSSSVGGAIALGIASVSLGLLVEVLKQLGAMDTGMLIKALLGLAGIFAVLGISAALLTPVVPILFALGAAILLLGAGFALFGVGVQGVAKGFEILARAGDAGISVLLELIDALIERIPAMVQAIATGLVAIVQTFLEAAPPLIEAFGVVIEQLLVSITEFIPEAVEMIKTFALEMLAALREVFPEYVTAGFEMLMAILKGIRDNIGEITTVVVEIITNFLDALALKVPEIIDSVYNLLISIIEGVVAKLIDIGSFLIPKGLELLGGLMTGISNFSTETLIPWFQNLPGNILSWIGDLVSLLWTKGDDVIRGFYNGIASYVSGTLMPWFQGLPGKIVGWIGDVFTTIRSKGSNILAGFYNGIIAFANETLIPWLQKLPSKVVSWVGDVFTILRSKGTNILAGFYNGIIAFANDSLIPWLQKLPSKVVSWVGDMGRVLYNAGLSVLRGFLSGMKAAWEEAANWLGGLASKIPKLKGPPKRDAVILEGNGRLIIEGLQNGMMDEWDLVARWLSSLNPADEMSNDFNGRMRELFGNITDAVGDMDGMTPVITPVLDLTNVERDSQLLSSMMSAATIKPNAQAQLIAASSISGSSPIDEASATAGGLKFEQNIYAPTQLSAGDIYKQTRTQLTIAKQELDIP